MKINISYEEALAKASPRLREQIKWSVELLRKSEPLMLKYDAENGGWLGFSGGKDSQALYHIAQLAGVKFKAYFAPTSIDPAQVIKFIRKQYPEVEFGKLKESIFTTFKRYKILPTALARWCCRDFKEKGGENKVVLTGVRKAESARRSKRKEVEVTSRKFSGTLNEFEEYSEATLRKRLTNLNQDQFAKAKISEVRCIKGKDKIIINPIINWTDEDVWEFLNEVVDVPHCELYDPPYNQKRIGCIGCPMSSKKDLKIAFKLHPYTKERWIKAVVDVRKDVYSKWLSTPPELRENKASAWKPDWAMQLVEALNLDYELISLFNGGLYDKQTERIIAEQVIDWWISKKSFDQWFAEKFLQQKLDFDE